MEKRLFSMKIFEASRVQANFALFTACLGTIRAHSTTDSVVYFLKTVFLNILLPQSNAQFRHNGPRPKLRVNGLTAGESVAKSGDRVNFRFNNTKKVLLWKKLIFSARTLAI
jgi:hypothetical protein